MYTQFITNYESQKLVIHNPNLYNAIFLLSCVVLCYSWLSSPKKHIYNSNILSISQTTQLRGLAILFVIIGHFWVHVVKQTPLILFGGDSVALFLLLSGFGLAASNNKTPFVFFRFLLKRSRRIYIPYWLSTILILFLDHFLLLRNYSPKDFLMTLFGINITPTTRNIDYVRWYITLQLFWYIIYAFIFRFNLSKKKSIVYLLSIASFTFIFDYYISRLGWYQIYAFPCGVAVGCYYQEIKQFCANKLIPIGLAGAVALLLDITFKLTEHSIIEPSMPSIFFKAICEGASLLFCFSLIALTALLNEYNKVSVLLTFCGGISYEMFLLHGPFLVKYDPIIRQASPQMISFLLAIFVGSTAIFAYAFQQFNICLTKLFSK